MRDCDQAFDGRQLMLRWGLLPIGFVALVACNVAANEGREASSVAAPNSSQAAVEPASSPQAAPEPTPTAPARTSFSFDGELTQGGWIKGQAPSDTAKAKLGDQELLLTQDGRFFAAFDRDAGTEAQLVAELADGSQISETLTLSPRKWQIQRVNVNRGRGKNLEAYWKKREPEYNAIVAARAKVTDAEGWKQDFIWPVKGRISGKFGRQRIYADEPGSYHSGLDIAPGHGVPFVAPADGVVVLARTGFSLEGNLIIIDHGAGLNSAFLHASKIVVSEGQSVKQGQHIGNVGSTGRSTGPHLHWGLKWGASRIDPLLLVGPQ